MPAGHVGPKSFQFKLNASDYNYCDGIHLEVLTSGGHGNWTISIRDPQNTLIEPVASGLLQADTSVAPDQKFFTGAVFKLRTGDDITVTLAAGHALTSELRLNIHFRTIKSEE